MMISLLPKDAGRADGGNALRIGTGDDISGFLLQQVLKTSEETDKSLGVTGIEFKIEAYEFQDC